MTQPKDMSTSPGAGAHAPWTGQWLPIAAAALESLSAAERAHWPPAFTPERRPREKKGGARLLPAGGGLPRTGAVPDVGELPSAAQMEEWLQQVSPIMAGGRLRLTIHLSVGDAPGVIAAALLGHSCVVLCRNAIPDPSALTGFLGTTCTPAQLGQVVTSVIPDDGVRTVVSVLGDRVDSAHVRRWLIHYCPDCPHGGPMLLVNGVEERIRTELAGTGFQRWIRTRLADDLMAVTAALAIKEDQ